MKLTPAEKNNARLRGWRAKNKKKYATQVRAKYKENKLRAIAYKGGSCSVCSAHDLHFACYDFHHIDPSVKDKGLGRMLNGAWKTIQAELDKCVLICSNCHRALHYGIEEQKK